MTMQVPAMPGQPSDNTSPTGPGWYPDPNRPGYSRIWDGKGWQGGWRLTPTVPAPRDPTIPETTPRGAPTATVAWGLIAVGTELVAGACVLVTMLSGEPVAGVTGVAFVTFVLIAVFGPFLVIPAGIVAVWLGHGFHDRLSRAGFWLGVVGLVVAVPWSVVMAASVLTGNFNP
jgi:hypothetical protein